LDGSNGSLYRLNEEIKESGMKFGKKVPSTLKIPLSWSVGDTGGLCQHQWISPKDGWHDDRQYLSSYLHTPLAFAHSLGGLPARLPVVPGEVREES
jgi:predicted DNA-binding ArsR family transcriptional regulator